MLAYNPQSFVCYSPSASTPMFYFCFKYYVCIYICILPRNIYMLKSEFCISWIGFTNSGNGWYLSMLFGVYAGIFFFDASTHFCGVECPWFSNDWPPPHVLLLQFFHSTLCPKMSSDQFSLVMSAVFRGWKKLPIYIIYIYICRDLWTNQDFMACQLWVECCRCSNGKEEERCHRNRIEWDDLGQSNDRWLNCTELMRR